MTIENGGRPEGRLAKEKTMSPVAVDAVQGKAHELLDPERLKKLTESPEKHDELRRVLTFFPRLRPDGLLDDLHTDLHFSFVTGLTDPGGQHGDAIMGSHVGVGGVELGLVAVRVGDAGLEVVGDEGLGDTAEERQCPYMGVNPIGQ